MGSRFDRIEDALADLARGKPVVVVDDEDRENEGDLVFPAQFATPKLVAFTVRHTSGYLCVALTGPDADRLGLPPMVAQNEDPRQTAYTVTVDARQGISTGISARDRAHTIKLLAEQTTAPADLSRPGHVVPLRARAGGVLERAGHTEAAVDLMKLAGLRPAGLLCEIVSEHDATGMARLPELTEFATRYDLRLISIAELARYRRERQLERVVETRLPLRAGEFRAVGYRDDVDGREHVALVLGDVAGADVLVRVHSECLTGDVFGSLRCDCGPQLTDALAAIGAEGRGVVVYLRGHEGRGIGLLDKLRAYGLQDSGADTVDANLELGLPVDARDYAIAAKILRDLEVGSARLLTGNPAKAQSLREHGIPVGELVPLPVRVTKHNRRYLETKVERLGHELALRRTSDRAVIGTVVHGDARGRELGFPTANLEIEVDGAALGDGVYGGLARVLDDPADETCCVAAISVGTNPTFPGGGQRFEVHLLDFAGDLYGRRLEVVPLSFVRPTLAFDSVAALVAQIEGDVWEIRRIAVGWHHHVQQLKVV
jgi:3,4-dihydroxy 2-butanone 4-phosphate synthase/GTP cyclohydrolase II